MGQQILYVLFPATVYPMEAELFVCYPQRLARTVVFTICDCLIPSRLVMCLTVILRLCPEIELAVLVSAEFLKDIHSSRQTELMGRP